MNTRSALGLALAGTTILLTAACTPPSQTPTSAEPSQSAPATTTTAAAITPPRLTDAAGLVLSNEENSYNGRLALDFTPFREAMDGMDAERKTAIQKAVFGKSVAEIAAAKTELKFTTVELVIAVLHGIEENEYTNPVLQLDPTALEQAAAVDAAVDAGTLTSPLAGTVTLVKGNIAVAGLANDAGSWALADRVAHADAPTVAKLREAGVVVLGRSNLSELAYFLSNTAPSGFSARGGQTLSPVDALGIDPVGSSTGSAVAVQLGLVPFALGTETAGSIIYPAFVAGVVGYRTGGQHWPSGGIVPLDSQLDAPGVLARTVVDAALVEQAITGVAAPTEVPSVAIVAGAEASVALTSTLTDAGVTVVPSDATLQAAVAAADAAFVEELMVCGFRDSLDSYLADGAGAITNTTSLATWYDENPEHAPYGSDLVTSAATSATSQQDCTSLHARAAAAVTAVGTELDRVGADVIVGDIESTTFVVMNGGPRIHIASGVVASGIESEDAPSLLALGATLAP